MNIMSIAKLRRSGKPIPEDRDTERQLILLYMNGKRSDFGEDRELFERVMRMIYNNAHRIPHLNPKSEPVSYLSRYKTMAEIRDEFDPCDADLHDCDCGECEDCDDE